jgi:hypothetical protein
MRACNEFKSLLFLYAGEDLGPDQIAAVRAHLVQCEPCSSEARAAARARQAFALGAIDIGPERVDLWPAVRARLAGEPSARHEREQAAPRPRVAPAASRLLRFAGGLAAAAAVIALARPLWLRPPSGSEPVPEGRVPNGGELVDTTPASSLPVPGPARIPTGADPIEGAARLLADADGLLRVSDPSQPSLRESYLRENRSGWQLLPVHQVDFGRQNEAQAAGLR